MECDRTSPFAHIRAIKSRLLSSAIETKPQILACSTCIASTDHVLSVLSHPCSPQVRRRSTTERLPFLLIRLPRMRQLRWRVRDVGMQREVGCAAIDRTAETAVWSDELLCMGKVNGSSCRHQVLPVADAGTKCRPLPRYRSVGTSP